MNRLNASMQQMLGGFTDSILPTIDSDGGSSDKKGLFNESGFSQESGCHEGLPTHGSSGKDISPIGKT
jgi:hypothetical protein